MDVEFLLRGGVDVGEEVGQVLRGLEVDFAVVGVHCLLWRLGRGGGAGWLLGDGFTGGIA